MNYFKANGHAFVEPNTEEVELLRQVCDWLASRIDGYDQGVDLADFERHLTGHAIEMRHWNKFDDLAVLYLHKMPKDMEDQVRQMRRGMKEAFTGLVILKSTG